MNLVLLVGVALIAAIGGMWSLYHSNIVEAPSEPPKPDYTEFTLNSDLINSQEKISKVVNKFQNGQYTGEESIQDAINTIKQEIRIQKQLFDDYKNLPPQMQTSLDIAQKFQEIERKWFANEESIIAFMSRQIDG